MTIRALLRHAHQHKYDEKVFGHDDMAVCHEARLVHVIIRLPHVVNEVREGLVMALNANELAGQAHGECDALGV
jgi:hypothetical protein